MAINPNTNFSAGAVLTSAQQNRFPRGVMAFTKATASGAINSEAVQITGSSFTAVANRYYKILPNSNARGHDLCCCHNSHRWHCQPRCYFGTY